jgi:hypothetical protein
MDALRNQILERTVIQKIVEVANVASKDGGSILKADPEEFSVEFMVAPVATELPEALYDEQPEDGAPDKGMVKPS